MHVALVAPPWQNPTRPSIQLGLLGPVVRASGASVSQHAAYLTWFELLATRHNDPDVAYRLYGDIGEGLFTQLAGDWVFAGAVERALGVELGDQDAYFESTKPELPEKMRDELRHLRNAAVGFVERECEKVLESSPDLIGFTTTFSQTLASLAMAATVKRMRPDVHITLGGSNCDGPMGRALLDAYDFIDTTVSGEGESALRKLLERLRAGESVAGIPGVWCRGSASLEPKAELQGVELAAEQTPDYDFHFERLATSPHGPYLEARSLLPIEVSRGCWWGEHHHCTFCGLNGSEMLYRKRDIAALPETSLELGRRYGILDFFAVDNIMPIEMVRMSEDLADALEATKARFFFETKVNVRRDQLSRLRRSGVVEVQPGIESLSTSVLRGIDKGTTAIQNVHFLISCVETGVVPDWNMILGLPCETQHTIKEQLDLLPSLLHLPAPNISWLEVERFSPYFDRPADFGIDLLGPGPVYPHVYSTVQEELLSELAYFNEHQVPAHEPHEVRALLERLEASLRLWDKLDGIELSFRRLAGDVVVIRDTRPLPTPTRLVVDGARARLLLATVGGCALTELTSEAERLNLDPDELKRHLEWLIDHRLVMTEGKSFLCLATDGHHRPALHPLGASVPTVPKPRPATKGAVPNTHRNVRHQREGERHGSSSRLPTNDHRVPR